MCGQTNISLNNNDVYLLKTDASGNLQWTKTYGGLLTEQGYFVIQTLDGGFALTGVTNSFGVPGEGNVFLIKTNSFGDTVWTKTYGGNDEDDGQVVLQTSDGGYMIGAMSFSFGAVDFDYYLIKTDANGDTLWTKTYGGNLEDDLLSINQTSDGGYIVTGSSWIFTGSTGNFNNNTLRINSFGDTIWTRSFGMPGYNDGGAFAQQTMDGGFVIFNWGGMGSGNSGLSHLIKTDADGNTKCPNSFIQFNIGSPPTQVIGSNWSVGTMGTEKKIPTIVKDSVVLDSILCEQCGNIILRFDETLCRGEKDTFLVTSSVNSTYLWEPSDFLSCYDCPDPLASPDTTMYYYLTATDVNGCISIDSIQIKVDSCETDIFIPNVFSPDGDGKNDQWVIKGIGNNGWDVQIFNRWGELMYQTDKPAEKYWDGRTFSGVQLNSGVFYYILNNNELDISHKGFFHLLR